MRAQAVICFFRFFFCVCFHIFFLLIIFSCRMIACLLSGWVGGRPGKMTLIWSAIMKIKRYKFYLLWPSKFTSLKTYRVLMRGACSAIRFSEANCLSHCCCDMRITGSFFYFYFLKILPRCFLVSSGG